MSFASIFTPKKAHLTLIVDVGSASVGAALISTKDPRTPLILESVRVPMVFQDELNFKRFLDDTATSLKKVLEKIQKKHTPKHFCFILSSPWFVSQTRIFHYSSEKPFNITKSFLADLVEKEVTEFEKVELEKKHEMLSQHNVVIENKTMQTKLNGYITADPANKRAVEVELSTFISLSASETLDLFRQVTQSVFHRDEINFHTFLYAGYFLIHDILKLSNNFILMDINGELTDVSVIHDGIVIETVSYPIGRNFLIRGIAKNLSTVPEEAESILRASQEGTLNQVMIDKIHDALLPLRKEWIQSLRKVLEVSSYEYILPHDVYIMTHQDVGQIFADFIALENLDQFTITSQPFTPVVITNKMIGDHCRTDIGVNRDLFLMIESIFISNTENVL